AVGSSSTVRLTGRVTSAVRAVVGSCRMVMRYLSCVGAAGGVVALVRWQPGGGICFQAASARGGTEAAMRASSASACSGQGWCWQGGRPASRGGGCRGAAGWRCTARTELRGCRSRWRADAGARRVRGRRSAGPSGGPRQAVLLVAEEVGEGGVEGVGDAVGEWDAAPLLVELDVSEGLFVAADLSGDVSDATAQGFSALPDLLPVEGRRSEQHTSE